MIDAQVEFEAMEKACRALFETYFEPAIVEQHFVIPAAYRDFLLLTGGTVQRGGIYGMTLFGVTSIAGNTAYSCNLFAENRPENAGMVLEIGHWSDKHDLFLVCDTRHELYGAVLDGHTIIPG